MPPDPHKIQSLFHEAIEQLAAADWPAFLDRACENDAELRHAVEALLRGHEQANSLLDESACSSQTADAVNVAVPGTVIGPYKLLEQIGEGGMGTVWMAQQTEPVKRVVALKLVKAGMDSRQVIARFEAERQALALMDHPNIAKVFDAGAASNGRPYFVMELVKGVPITRYCDDHQLTPRQRLELFVPVCQAVQHAHQKGVIHRDLKPTNILIALYDDRPVPKIIDFGVAKATGQQLTEQTLHTGFGAVVGTVEYMSPEQATFNQLDIDTRSDIYALGVLLYELLTGSPPFSRKELEKAGMLEMLRVIREQDPSKPSIKLSSSEALPTLSANRGTEPAKLTKLVRGELDWIVMKALEKDRSRRYETANGFAMDVQRYLADEPVQACPPSVGYRFRKFARRNKAALVLVASVAAALLAGTIISTWQAVRASKAEQKAQANFEKAREAVKRMLTRVAQEELVDVPWMEPVRKVLLEDAVQFYEQLLADRTTDPEIRLATAHAQLDLVIIHNKEGEPQCRWESDQRAGHAIDGGAVGGEKTGQFEYRIRRALELLEPLVKEYAEDWRYRAGLARALHHQSHQTAWDPERWTEAVQLLRRAVELQESVVSATPDSAENAFQLADTFQMLGNALSTGGRSEEAVAAYRRAVAIGERVTARDPNNAAHLRAQMRGLTGIAGLLSKKEPAQAEALLLRAQALAPRFQAAGRKTGLLFDSSAVALASVEQGLGNLYQSQGRTKDAQAAFRRALAVYQKYSSDFPSLRFYRERLAWAASRLGDALTDPADRKEAESCYRTSIEAHEKLVADSPKSPLYRKGLVRAYRPLGGLLEATDRPEEAEKALRRALSLALQLGEDSPELEYRLEAGWSCERLGLLLERTKRPDEAEERYRQAIKIFQTAVADRPAGHESRSYIGYTYGHLATLHRDNGKPKEAEEAARQSLAVFDKLAADFPEQAKYREALANTYQWQLARIFDASARPKDAENARRQALSILQKLAADFPGESQYWHKLGALQHSFAHHDDAVTSFSKALKVDAASWESWHLRGIAFAKLGQWEKAVADQTRATDLKSDHPWSWYQRGLGHSRLNQWDKAVAEFSKAIELKRDYWQAYHDRGLSLGKLDQWEKAVADQTQAVKLNPDHPWSWHQRGLAHSRLTQWEKAIADFSKAIELKQDLWQAYHDRGWPLSKLGQWDKVIADQTKALELNPKHWWSLSRRGDAYSALTQWDKAIADYTEAIELGPTEPYVWVSKASAHARLNQLDQAMAELRQAVAKGYRDAKQLKNRGDLAGLRSRDDFKQLVAELEAKK
jgi:eukaryotic-like serine/threonine-protein kinase